MMILLIGVAVVGLVAVGAMVAVVLGRRGEEDGGSLPRALGPGATPEELLAAGQKLQAIKRYREIHGVGLKEAKDAVEGLARGRPRRSPRGPERGEDPEVEALIGEGNLIAAIKRYREIHGVGLKEAKDAVEARRDRRAGG